MQHEQPVLTIAIPTYNRSKYLKQLLTALAPQLSDKPNVELLISDNASTDETQSIVETLQTDGLNCRYIKNAINIGPDANFLQCFNEAQGKYFWLFGDDDVITPGGVSRVFDTIVESSPDLIYCAPYTYYDDYLADLKKIITRRTSEITRNVIRFVGLVNYHGDFIFISSLIVNKANILTHEHPPFDSLVNTNVLQLGWVFASLAHFTKGAFLQVGTVAGAADSSGDRFDQARAHVNGVTFDAAQVFGVNYAKAIAIFTPKGSKLAQALLNDQLFLWFTNNWVSMRECSHLELQHTELILRESFGSSLRYWLVVLPLTSLPLPLAKHCAKIFRVFARLNRTAHDL